MNSTPELQYYGFKKQLCLLIVSAKSVKCYFLEALSLCNHKDSVGQSAGENLFYTNGL